MTGKKMSSAILSANGGLDSIRALNTARNILLSHDLRQPVLYHLVLTGSQSIADYQAVIKSLVRRLRSRCRTEYFGAYEVEPEAGKGLHAHCFFVIETSKKTPFKILDVNDGEYLHKLAIRHKLVNNDGSVRRIHVSKPKNSMHGGQFFARPVGEGLLANCLDWIEYEFKSRSKEGVQSRETYFNSEFRSNSAKRVAKKKSYSDSPPAALSAAKEAVVADKQQHLSNSINVKESPNEGRTQTPYRTDEQSEARAGSSEGRYNGFSIAALVSPGCSAYGGTEACIGPSRAANARYEDGSRAVTPYSESLNESKLSPAPAATVFDAKGEYSVVENASASA